MKAASIGRIAYAPDTRLDITASFPVAYDPTGKSVVFELIDAAGVVTFRFKSGADANLAINGQDIELRLTPSAASVEVKVGDTFAAVIAAATKSVVDFNIDLEDDGLVDYRFQGELKIYDAHGKFSA